VGITPGEVPLKVGQEPGDHGHTAWKICAFAHTLVNLKVSLNQCEFIVVPELVEAGVLPKLCSLLKDEPNPSDAMLEVWAEGLGVSVAKVELWLRHVRARRTYSTPSVAPRVRTASGPRQTNSHLPTPTSPEPPSSPSTPLSPVAPQWPAAGPSTSQKCGMTFLKQERPPSPELSPDELDELKSSPEPTQREGAESAPQQNSVPAIAVMSQTTPCAPVSTARQSSAIEQRPWIDKKLALMGAMKEAVLESTSLTHSKVDFWALVEQVTRDGQTATNLLQADLQQDT
jgi:hypothetical protein